AINAFERALRLDGVSAVVVGPAGGITGMLPKGISESDIHVDQLQAGKIVSGHHGDLVYAAAPRSTTRGTLVVVASRQADAGLGPAGRWFVVAAAISAVLAAIVALTLGRRLARPVRQVDEAARAIAGGAFSTRLPEPPSGASDELADLVRSINAMAAELERSQTLEQQFLLSVSHDLRTPLTSIRGYAEAIRDGATTDPAWASGVILSEARRLERLVRDLLDLARLRTRSFSLHSTPVDLGEVAGVVAEGFRPDTDAAGLTLAVERTGPVVVSADADRVAQVVANLIENAVKYASTTVRVAVTPEPGYGVVTVDDDGPGIPPDDLPFVFERLYVAGREPVRKESGSGLGLAIVRELLEAMGGRVEAQLRPGGGTRVVVYLLLAPVTSAMP
ncbi:MAG TPA: HAMP domain-containing sensor histidine kinase, partial [Acidimicrobiales bacterium]|nr:HAMP domain-containing sensor histidine kinase [Acidimicrobiales bacterium]